MNKVKKYLEQMKMVRNQSDEKGLRPLEIKIVLYMGSNGVNSEERAVKVSKVYESVAREHMARSTLSGALKRLRQQDYVAKIINPEDEREILTWLKKRGQDFYSELERSF